MCLFSLNNPSIALRTGFLLIYLRDVLFVTEITLLLDEDGFIAIKNHLSEQDDYILYKDC